MKGEPLHQILLVDDSETIQLVILGILDSLGLCADVVNSGSESIQALSHEDYDLVLMDIQMPDLDGYQTTRIIRNPASTVRNHHIPIIAMTGNIGASERKACLEAGMDDYLAKPIYRQELTIILSRWLRNSLPGRQVTIPEYMMTSQALQYFNQENLLDRVAGDLDLAQCVVRGFLQEVPLKLAEIRMALERVDAIACERSVHTIKGSAATVGADVFSMLAWDLELAANSGNLERVSHRMPELEAQFRELKPVLTGFTMAPTTPCPGE